MNIVFAGTPFFSQKILKALLLHPHITLSAVFTQPDRPNGRGQQLLPCPTKVLAQAHNLPVYQYTSLKTPENQTHIFALPWNKVDLLITAAYGLILPPYFLTLPKYGCWNVHASLLPRWRGASPIQQAILAGDATTGITLMQMAEGLDNGDMLWQEACSITPQDTYGSLEQKLAHIASSLLTHALDDFIKNPRSLTPVTQNELFVTHAPKIDKQEAHLNWSLPAEQLERKIRAFDPAPGCFTLYQEQRIKIWGAHTLTEQQATHPPGTLVAFSPTGLVIQAGQNSLLQITCCQLPGKNKAPISQILNGHPNFFTLHSLLK